MYYVLEQGILSEFKDKKDCEDFLSDLVEQGNIDLNGLKIIEGNDVGFEAKLKLKDGSYRNY